MFIVKYYLIIAISLFVAAIMIAQPIISALLLWGSLSVTLVTIAYLFDIPSIFRKQQDGRIAIWIRWAFIPFLLGVKAYNVWSIKRDRVDPIQKVAPNLYLSRRLFKADLAFLKAQNINCVVDVTAEFMGVESVSADKHLHYFCLPVLDHKAPKEKHLIHALNWIDTQIKQGRSVVIHCALGRGRSVFTAAAYLLSQDPALSVKQVLAKINNVRNTAKLNHSQLKALYKINDEAGLTLAPTAWLIANPAAGGGKWAQHEQQLIHSLTQKYRLNVHLTTQVKSARYFAQQAKKQGVTHLIVCGGDGTVSEVAEICANTDITLGIVPFGTANALCHVLYGISVKVSPIAKACEAILSGNSKSIDVAYCNQKIALLVIGIGFQEKMIHEADRERKNALGQFAYLTSFFNAVVDGESQNFTMQVDERPSEQHELQSLVVANTSPFSSVLAQGGKHAPQPDDGKLHITYLNNTELLGSRILALSDLTLSSLGEREASSYFDYQSGHRVVIESDQRIHYAIDGEPGNADKLVINLVHNALNVSIP